MSKKEVVFHEVCVPPVVGAGAVVVVREHHTIGTIPDGSVTFTTKVVRVNEDGSFETRNSLYVPATPEAAKSALDTDPPHFPAGATPLPKSQTL